MASHHNVVPSVHRQRRAVSLQARLFVLFGVAALPVAAPALAQGSGSDTNTFVLHKFAREIGKESYTVTRTGSQYRLTSHFLFTDRGSPVALETTYSAKSATMRPIHYQSKGKSSRHSHSDDAIDWDSKALRVVSSGKTTKVTPAGAWCIADGYSPVAMQEQMVHWWLSHGRPATFTAYPSASAVRIEPAASLTVNGVRLRGYTVTGLIWGTEALWLDDAQRLIALISIDAEFDHFEAIREKYEPHLGDFISAAVKADLDVLARLSSSSGAVQTPRKLAIVGATLEDSTGVPPVSDSVILIENGLITAVGTRASLPIPNDATILDATGKFALPGLWDMHAHYEQVEWGPIYLASGVTSVRDVGNEFEFIRTLREALDRNQTTAVGPHMEFAGIIDGESPFALGAVTADMPGEARARVAAYRAAGARQIKIYSSVKPEVVKAICAEAHARGMTVTGHIPEHMTALEGVEDGMDQINHIEYDVFPFIRPQIGTDGKPDYKSKPVFDANTEAAKHMIRVFKEHKTVLDPTLAIFEWVYHLSNQPVASFEPGITHVAPQLRAALDQSTIDASDKSPFSSAARATFLWDVYQRTLRALHEAGIPMVAGTDQVIPGYSLHRELELYVENGFTPLEAIQSATIVAARAAGVESESGSLAVGKRGDVLLLDADPLADIHNSRKVWRTVAAGRVYDPAPLWRSVGFTP